MPRLIAQTDRQNLSSKLIGDVIWSNAFGCVQELNDDGAIASS
jgi:hypothetical protein